MSFTPLFDKLMVPGINKATPRPEVPPDMSGDKDVIVLGYGRFGQIVTRM